MRKIVAIFSFLLVSLNAHADLIKVSFEANVTRIYEADCIQFENNSCGDWDFTDVNSSAFFNGQTISMTDTAQGYFVYDTDTDYRLSDDGYQAVYLDALVDFTMIFGSLIYPNPLLPFSSGSMSVVNDRPSFNSTIDMLFAAPRFSLGDWFSSVNIFLTDNDGEYFDGFDLPTNGNLSDFSWTRFQTAFVYRPTGDQLQIKGDVTNVYFENIIVVNAPSISLFSLFIFLFGIRHLKVTR